MSVAVHPSPLGPLVVRVDDSGALRAIEIDGVTAKDEPLDPGACAVVTRQLDEYFAGTRTRFDLALALDGTPFQRLTWRALMEIPHGETISYGELARRMGRPAAVRAVGRANGANPIPIVVPCHRVIGADGSLTGFGAGLDAKRALLRHEAAGRQGELFAAERAEG